MLQKPNLELFELILTELLMTAEGSTEIHFEFVVPKPYANLR